MVSRKLRSWILSFRKLILSDLLSNLYISSSFYIVFNQPGSRTAFVSVFYCPLFCSFSFSISLCLVVITCNLLSSFKQPLPVFVSLQIRLSDFGFINCDYLDFALKESLQAKLTFGMPSFFHTWTMGVSKTQTSKTQTPEKLRLMA